MDVLAASDGPALRGCANVMRLPADRGDGRRSALGQERDVIHQSEEATSPCVCRKNLRAGTPSPFTPSGKSATKHKCVHHFKVTLNLPNHVIAAQMGWSEAAVEKMVATYAHTEIGALEAIDAAFAVLPDTNPIYEAAPPASS